jgi:hypothetical protein
MLSIRQAGLRTDTASRTAEQHRNLSLVSGSRRTRAAGHWWVGPSSRHGGRRAAGLRLQALASSQCRVIGETYLGQRRAPLATTAYQRRVSGQSVRATAGRRTYAGSGGFHVCQARRTGLRNGTASRAARQYSNLSSGQHSRVQVRSQSVRHCHRAGSPPGHESAQVHGSGFSSCTGRHQQKGCPNGRGGRQPPANGYDNYWSVQMSATGFLDQQVQKIVRSFFD